MEDGNPWMWLRRLPSWGKVLGPMDHSAVPMIIWGCPHSSSLLDNRNTGSADGCHHAQLWPHQRPQALEEVKADKFNRRAVPILPPLAYGAPGEVGVGGSVLERVERQG